MREDPAGARDGQRGDVGGAALRCTGMRRTGMRHVAGWSCRPRTSLLPCRPYGLRASPASGSGGRRGRCGSWALGKCCRVPRGSASQGCSRQRMREPLSASLGAVRDTGFPLGTRRAWVGRFCRHPVCPVLRDEVPSLRRVNRADRSAAAAEQPGCRLLPLCLPCSAAVFSTPQFVPWARDSHGTFLFLFLTHNALQCSAVISL